MTVQTLTLHLPARTYQRLQQRAEATQHSVEDEVLAVVETALKADQLKILSFLQHLERKDKLRAMQFLLSELAREEGILLPALEDFFTQGASYPVWSPYDAHEAAYSLLKLLEEDKAANHA